VKRHQIFDACFSIKGLSQGGRGINDDEVGSSKPKEERKNHLGEVVVEYLHADLPFEP